MKPDKNYLSFNGDAAGNVWLNGVLIAQAEMPGVREYVIEGAVEPPDDTYADALKFSGVQRLRVVVDRVVGGREDCVDVNNHCRDVEVVARLGFVPRGKYVATIKGGSRNITLRGPVLGHGTEVDFDCGNHSDQSDNETQGITLDLWTPDGSAITWRQLNGSDIRLREGQAWRAVLRIRGGFWRNLFAKVYAFGKKHMGLPICLALALTAAGCKTVPQIITKAGAVIGVPDAGKPATLTSGESRTGFRVPANSRLTVTKTEAAPDAPAREVSVWEFSAPTQFEQVSSSILANTGTVDTVVATRRIDAEERRWLLWAGIGAVLVGIVLMANPYVRWPLGGALIAGAGGLFIFAHQTPAVFTVAVCVGVLAVGIIGGSELMERIKNREINAP